MKKKVLLTLLSLAPFLAMSATPQFAVGGGYLDAGPRHSGSCGQIELRGANEFLGFIRPGAQIVFPEFRSVFFGIGIGVDLYLFKAIVVTPSFSPGLYLQGSGRDLGSVLEFRSALELAYQWTNCVRLGGQISHISNASISSRNPGMNALTLVLALPIRK